MSSGRVGVVSSWQYVSPPPKGRKTCTPKTHQDLDCFTGHPMLFSLKISKPLQKPHAEHTVQPVDSKNRFEAGTSGESFKTNNLFLSCLCKWWLNQPIEKYASQIGSCPQFSGSKCKKYLSCHHLVIVLVFYFFSVKFHKRIHVRSDSDRPAAEKTEERLLDSKRPNSCNASAQGKFASFG